MLIKDLLSDDDNAKLQSLNKSSKHKRNKQQYKPVKLKEKHTTREWRELMGTNRDTYVRRNGAIRRK